MFPKPVNNMKIDEWRSKVAEMHILDGLDYLNNTTIDIPQDVRSELLREIVLTLKSELPKSYEEAWNHPDLKFREKWRSAITKELTSMEKRAVWKIIKRSKMPKNRRCVKSKWVFDIKRSGIFKV